MESNVEDVIPGQENILYVCPECKKVFNGQENLQSYFKQLTDQCLDRIDGGESQRSQHYKHHYSKVFADKDFYQKQGLSEKNMTELAQRQAEQHAIIEGQYQCTNDRCRIFLRVIVLPNPDGKTCRAVFCKKIGKKLQRTNVAF